MKERPNPVREKSYGFALKIIPFCRDLMENKKEYILSRQLLRPGTSIGANVEEGVNAQSKKDFANKMSIALKESYESRYWLSLIRDSKLATQNEIGNLLMNVQELIALLTAILKSARSSIS